MDAIITVDESHLVILFNSAAEKVFGFSAADAFGQPLERFIPALFRAAHPEHLNGFGDHNATRRSKAAPLNLYGVKQSGEQFPIEASISQIQVNENRLFTVILRDITERKRAEDELRLSEERFGKAFRANPQPMSLTTVDEGLYLDVNDSFLA